MIKLKDNIEQSGIAMLEIEGDLTFESLQTILEKVEMMEAAYPNGFNRFTDLSHLRHITLTSDEIWNISQRRQMMYKGPLVKSAIYACNSLMFGMMRIYTTMMDPSLIDVNVFYNLDEWAHWLDAPADLLQVGQKGFETLCMNE